MSAAFNLIREMSGRRSKFGRRGQGAETEPGKCSERIRMSRSESGSTVTACSPAVLETDAYCGDPDERIV